MTYAVLLILAVMVGYNLGARYLARSLNSFSSAERVAGDLNRAIRAFVDQDSVPATAAQFAIQIGALAGCGCFVRGVLFNHYLPRSAVQVGTHPERMQPVADAVTGLDIDRRADFDRIVALVIVYDSFRNPLQGWLFRRVLKSYLSPKPSWEDQMEAKYAAFSVASRKMVAA